MKQFCLYRELGVEPVRVAFLDYESDLVYVLAKLVLYHGSVHEALVRLLSSIDAIVVKGQARLYGVVEFMKERGILRRALEECIWPEDYDRIVKPEEDKWLSDDWDKYVNFERFSPDCWVNSVLSYEE